MTTTTTNKPTVAPPLTLTDRQKYLFDLQGFLVVENVLSDEQCETAKAKINGVLTPLEKTPDQYDAKNTWFGTSKPLLDLGEPFIELIDHPKVIAVLQGIISPKLRMEAAYSFVRTKGCPPFEMHGGYAGGGVNFRYNVRGNRIYTGLCVVSFTLQDIDEKDGGFACIPGSHKSDFPITGEDRKELFRFGGPLVRNIAAPKGAAIIFTETLAHGANTWQQDEPRVGVFYKYNDRAAIYHGQEHRMPSRKALDMMTDAQKCYFNPAYEAFGPEGRFRNDTPHPGLM